MSFLETTRKFNITAPVNQLGYGVTGFNVTKSLMELGHNVALFTLGPVDVPKEHHDL